MGGQAGQLQELMSFFKIENAAAHAPAARSRTAAHAVATHAPARSSAQKTTVASSGDQDFERF